MTPRNAAELRILVVAPTGRDGRLICEALNRGGFDALGCQPLSAAIEELSRGVGALLIAEEALDRSGGEMLSAVLHDQPPWSDVSVLLLTTGGEPSGARDDLTDIRRLLGNATLIERPLHSRTLLSLVDTALRARRRQYEIRNYLEERQRREEELRRTSEALRQSREGLEQQVKRRTAALRRLSSTLIGIQDNERRRIARELHDSLGQYLTALTMQLGALQASAGPALQKGLAEAQATAQQCILETRTLSHLLHPPLLDEMGLESAVRWYVEGFAKRSGVDIDLHVQSPIERLQREVEVMFFRVLQESLTNIHKHSGSDSAQVTLLCSDHEVVLEVRDFGRGMPGNLLDRFLASGEGTGVGLAGIRERVNDLGGQLEIESGTSGTLVRVSLSAKGKPAAMSGN